VLLKFFLFALLLLLGVQGGYAEASKGGRQRGQGHAKQPRHAMQSPALFTTSFCVLVAFFSASRELQPGGYCFHCFYCFFCFGQDIARLARNRKKSERIPLRALLSGNNNLTACICNLCDEWANLAALQMQMATEGSPKITPLSRFSPFEL